MKLELVRELGNQSHHSSIVRSRRQFGEDRLIASNEEFYSEDAMTAERLHNLARLEPRRLERFEGDGRRLPALAIIAEILPMPDRGAEEDSILGRDGEQGDLAVELHEFLDDHPRPVTAHLFDGMVPGS